MNALAKRILKFARATYDENIELDDVLGWMEEQDEDELIANDVETLAQWFWESC